MSVPPVGDVGIKAVLSENSVTVRASHRFKVSPQRLFDAWFDSATAGRWLFATETGTMIGVEIDPRVGGRFNFTDRRDGEDIAHTGAYLEIDRPHRLVFTFSVPKFSEESTRVATGIVSIDGGCVLSLTHEGVLAECAGRTAAGWANILAGLESTLD